MPANHSVPALYPPYRGWRATSAGVKSSSQLLALAPAVLHDMAVMVAEAAAAGYLSDVDAGLDPAAALQSAAALQAGGGTPGSGGTSSGGVASSSGTGMQPLGSMDGAAQRPSSSGSAMAPAGALASQEDLEMTSSNSSGSSGGGREGAGGLVPLEASYWPTFLHRQLSSTRQLQRFTNQASEWPWPLLRHAAPEHSQPWALQKDPYHSVNNHLAELP